ncbi:MAG: acetyltransferase [Candidatus Dormibacteraeota bacterium]|uniref:Acetyltransferase n=1 Tax=Candidatus Amunia macphersoniae TaxID=3127014 RepID=A0A934KE99_9BACT|nr:acetyltransferase [Candidatus Dormibacteraeota bacterium]
MPQPVEGRRRYMAGLDGLRAIAVIVVVAYHLDAGWAPGGLLGVGVFFVLSGYLITDLMLGQREITGRISLGQFWARRARRLLPALWVMLVTVVLWLSLVDSGQVAALRGQVLAALVYGSNWWYAFQHVSYFASLGPPSPLGHLWSLAVEEQFYLVWPLLLLLALRLVRNRRTLVLLTVLGAAVSAWLMATTYQPGGDPNRVYYGTDTRAFELLVGASLALVWPSTHLLGVSSRVRRLALDVAGTLGLAIIVLMVWSTNQYQGFLYRGGMLILAIATAGAVAALAHPSTLVGKLLGIGPLRWLGARSYGIYLWHYPIIILTTPLVDSPGAHLVRSACQVGATLVIAALSWRYLEEPIRRGGVAEVRAGLRTPRWTIVGAPGGLLAATGAVVLAVGTSTVALAGLLPAGRAGAPATPQLVASLRLPAHAVSPPTEPCERLAALPTPSTPATPAPSPAALPAPAPVEVTAIGDSIMIDVAPYLQAVLPGAVIDGQVSRQMNQLRDVIAQLRAQGQLHSRIVIELGTNGPFDEGELISTLQSFGRMDRVVLVNTMVPRPWVGYVNQTLADVAAHLPDTVVVDWYGPSAGKPQYFYEDGFHPDPEGARLLAALIAHAVDPSPAASAPADGQRTQHRSGCG